MNHTITSEVSICHKDVDDIDQVVVDDDDVVDGNVSVVVVVGDGLRDWVNLVVMFLPSSVGGSISGE